MQEGKKNTNHQRRIFYILVIVVVIEAIIGLSFFSYFAFIIQKSAFSPLQQAPSFIGLNSQQYNKLENQLFALVDNQDPRAALKKVKKEMAQDPKFMASCHELLHDIGKKSYEKYHDFAKAMEYRDETCISGYTHGVLEAYFSQTSHPLSSMTSLCNHYPVGKYIRWECIHGVGHGLMYYTANDLPASLSNCKIFANPFDLDACVSGVYMENFNSDTSLHPSRYVSFSDPFKSCRNHTEYSRECYSTVPIYFLNYRKDDFAQALHWCDSAAYLYRQFCYKGVGEQMARREYNNPKAIETLCMSQGENKTLPCIAGMMSWYIDMYESAEKLETICNQLSQKNKNICDQETAAIKNFF